MLPDLNSQFLVQIISINNNIRSENLEAKLAEFGIEYKIPPEVRPDVINFQAGLLHSESLSKLICQRPLTIGEIGCTLAHRVAMKNFLNSDSKFGIFFEDDAEVIAEFNFETLMNLLDSDLPIIAALGWIPGFAIAKKSRDLLGDEPIELMTSPTCTFAYAMNRPAAVLMTDSHEKIIDLPDWPIYTLNKVKFFSIHPHSPWVTANHDPKFSTIGERAKPVSKSPVGVLVTRIKLTASFVLLILLSRIIKLDASSKQIVHRLFIRDWLYKYGTRQVNGKSTRNSVVPTPLKLMKLMKLLRLY